MQSRCGPGPGECPQYSVVRVQNMTATGTCATSTRAKRSSRPVPQVFFASKALALSRCRSPSHSAATAGLTSPEPTRQAGHPIPSHPAGARKSARPVNAAGVGVVAGIGISFRGARHRRGRPCLPHLGAGTGSFRSWLGCLFRVRRERGDDGTGLISSPSTSFPLNKL